MKAYKLGILLILALLPIVACGPISDQGGGNGTDHGLAGGGVGGSGDGGGDGDPAATSTSLKINLSGRQAPWMDALELTIEGIDLNSTEESESDDGGWIEIDGNPQFYDMLQLTDGWETILQDAPVPFDLSGKIRIRIGSAAVSMGGETYDMQVVSSEQDIVPLQVDPLALGDGELSVDLEFDPIASVKCQGDGDGECKLQPEFSVVDWTTVGSLSGVLTPAGLEGAEVAVYENRNGALLAAVRVRDDGTYTIPRLTATKVSGEPILYTLEASAGGNTAQQSYADVAVVSGENVSGYDFVLSPDSEDSEDSEDSNEGRHGGRRH